MFRNVPARIADANLPTRALTFLLRAARLHLRLTSKEVRQQRAGTAVASVKNKYSSQGQRVASAHGAEAVSLAVGSGGVGRMVFLLPNRLSSINSLKI